jgi:hypothetical protein
MFNLIYNLKYILTQTYNIIFYNHKNKIIKKQNNKIRYFNLI